MIIPFKVIKELWTKENLAGLNIELDASDTQNAQIFQIDDSKTININLILTDEYLKKLEEQKVEDISIYYNPKLIKILKKYYPDKYIQEDIAELYKIELSYERFKLANAMSSYDNKFFKERKLILLQDIITGTKVKTIEAKYGDYITDKFINILKSNYAESYKVKYATTERGILLVLDENSYKTDPQLLRLQFMIRKIFTDVHYRNLRIVNLNEGFKSYFIPKDGFYPKLTLLVGKTAGNIFLYKAIKVFDPFSKIAWLTKENLHSNHDLIFDSIVSKLSQDYSEEYKIYSAEREDKQQLSPIALQDYRKRLSALGRDFSVPKYINLAYEILEKSSKYDMFQPKTHLMNTIIDLKADPGKIFKHLLIAS